MNYAAWQSGISIWTRESYRLEEEWKRGRLFPHIWVERSPNAPPIPEQTREPVAAELQMNRNASSANKEAADTAEVGRRLGSVPLLCLLTPYPPLPSKTTISLLGWELKTTTSWFC